MTGKKCTKKPDASAKLLFWLLNKPIACLTFSLPLTLPSPSSDLKVPTDFVGKPVKASSQNVGYVLRLKTLV